MYIHAVVQNPVDITLCQGENATFTCVVFISSGTPVPPEWFRDNITVDMIHHITISNLTEGITAPVYINSTVTVNNVGTCEDGVQYQCGIVPLLSSSATLNVIGECIHKYVHTYLLMYTIFLMSKCTQPPTVATYFLVFSDKFQVKQG